MEDTGVRLAALFGDDNVALGEISVVDLGDLAAVGLSRGKYPKGYPTLDLNEDAAMVAIGGGRSILAVADGHGGGDASRAALEAVRDAGPRLLSEEESLAKVVGRGLEAAVGGVRRALKMVSQERAGARTTFTLACVGSGSFAVGGFGDSRAARIRRRASRLVWESAPFLSPHTPVNDAWLAETPLSSGDWVVVASDGLFDFLGRQWKRTLEGIAAEPAASFVTEAIEAAFVGGAGDHIAVAASRGAG